MQKRIPTVLMRGGTSKGLFFHDNHLPADDGVRSRVILAAFGSPDPNRRQIDGVGGGVSTTSKVAIISPSQQPDYDVVYNFGQVSLDRPMVDFKSNCGNISSAATTPAGRRINRHPSRAVPDLGIPDTES